MLGDYRISKGKLIYFDIPRYNLKGTYLITQCKHTITNTKDYVSVSIQYHS